ncbi:hypothetical protein PR003_g15211 [Phytophthora rubi]|uniref:Uncharacterized protein n=1 Tax=Phytophthora rubi TaxID=129364 RepID=A0A6A3JGW5_9STRA|nr:hypothetical protein PR002_g19954 [Phytophthora rubi]KAE9330885.1 hypothetical protein PR003_g15211 [Phytophthora rubi]
MVAQSSGTSSQTWSTLPLDGGVKPTRVALPLSGTVTVELDEYWPSRGENQLAEPVRASTRSVAKL